MEELFQIIGRLYADIYHSQKFIENLKDQLKTKDSEILALKTKYATSSKEIIDK
jgi:hypothetical protein